MEPCAGGGDQDRPSAGVLSFASRQSIHGDAATVTRRSPGGLVGWQRRECDTVYRDNSVPRKNAAPGIRQSIHVDSLVRQQLDIHAHHELPEGVAFLAADVLFDQRSALQLNETVDPQSLSQFDRSLQSDTLGGEQWGTPIYFFPDGTSSTAQVLLSNDRNEIVRVYLRGLTGMVRVGRVESDTTMSGQGGLR